mgnify:CR=1 FL=1
MIAKNKKFDCVKMNHDIQRKLIDERKNMSKSAIRREQDESIRKNFLLNKFLPKENLSASQRS